MTADLERLIGRAVIDQTFRAHLLNDPDSAIAAAGVKLTPEAIARVKVHLAAGTDTKPALEQVDASTWS